MASKRKQGKSTSVKKGNTVTVIANRGNGKLAVRVEGGK